MDAALKGNEKKILQRCAIGPVSFTHAIDLAGKVQTRVIRSSISPSRQKECHALALQGLVSEQVSGCGGHGEPPEHTVTYALTAMGRLALGIHLPEPERTRGSTALSDAELEEQGIE